MKPAIVFLASAWGSRHGGINSFNADLATAAACAVANRTMQVICVTAEPVSEHEVWKASRLGIRIVTAPVRNREQWLPEDSVAILLALARVGGTHKVLWWIGHDVVTGEAAVALAQQAAGRSAVIHHMSYSDYAGYKDGTSTTARAKRARQRRLFVATDRHLAVGPLLQGRVAEMVGIPVQDVAALIPGLAEVTALPQRSQGLNAIIFGRLDSANDRIKQARLAVSAFASALGLAPPALCEAAKLTVIGVTEAEERVLKRLTSSKARRVVNLIAVPFLEDRDALLRELREANLALVLSWHEGFGLTAWEAIAAEVPLIVGRNSGVYRFLNAELPGGAAGFVRAVDVRGALSRRTGGHFRREDEDEVRDAILDIARDLAGVQERARLLRYLLRRYTWARTAEQLARALGLQRYTRRLLDFEASAQPPATRHMHPLLASRDLGYESVEAAWVFLNKSRFAYRQGDYETAYTNSRRAARLFEHYKLHTDTVAALIQAMSALRPTRQSSRMRYVILKTECLCSKHTIGINVRWLFLDRLALVLFDYATSASGFSKAAWVMEASEKIFRRISLDALNPQQLRFDSANSLRRRAFDQGLGRPAGLPRPHPIRARRTP